MEQITVTHNPNRQATVNALAVVGFIALVFVGMVLAIYAARYVPVAVSRIAAGAAYLSTNGSGNDNLQVVPNLPFPGESATSTATSTPAATATTTKPVTKPTTPVAAAPSVGKPSTTAYPISGTIAARPGTAYGLPNFTTSVTAVGYMNDNGVFVADKTINSDQALAVQFRITNTGTNVSGAWRIHAELPTRSNGTYKFNSDEQESLAPGSWVDYTLHLDPRDVRVGDDEEIDIVADSDNDVKESNENDNDATATISVSK